MCRSKVTRVDAPGHRQLLASSAYLNSSSHTTCSATMHNIGSVCQRDIMQYIYSGAIRDIGVGNILLCRMRWIHKSGVSNALLCRMGFGAIHNSGVGRPLACRIRSGTTHNSGVGSAVPCRIRFLLLQYDTPSLLKIWCRRLI